MQTFRNLRLAVRLGVAFGALALGLVIVAAVALASAGQNQSALESISKERVPALELVSDLGERTQSIAHKTAQHLYVFDGDLGAEDALQEEIEALRAQNTEDGDRLATIVRAAHSEAVDELGEYAAARDAYVTEWREALERSRQETVDGVEERDGSRTVYTRARRARSASEVATVSTPLEDAVGDAAPARPRRRLDAIAADQAHRS